MSDVDKNSHQERQVLRLEREFKHPADRVWRSLIDPARLGKWYPFRVVDMDPRVGGKISFDDGEGTIYHGEIRELEAPRIFSFTEADDLIHIELRPNGDRCLMIFTHTFDDPSIADHVEIGWKECFLELDRILNR